MQRSQEITRSSCQALQMTFVMLLERGSERAELKLPQSILHNPCSLENFVLGSLEGAHFMWSYCTHVNINVIYTHFSGHIKARIVIYIGLPREYCTPYSTYLLVVGRGRTPYSMYVCTVPEPIKREKILEIFKQRDYYYLGICESPSLSGTTNLALPLLVID